MLDPTNKMTEEEQHEFLEGLLKKKANLSFAVTAFQNLSDKGEISCPELLSLLSIDKNLLTDDGKKAVSYLESNADVSNDHFSFQNFKWKVLAFLSIQDLLTTPLFKDTEITNPFEIKYFYYESKYVLTEIIVASLNGLHLANKQLQRNFLEFNLLQCYHINKVKATRSFADFKNYLKKRINPGLNKLIEGAVPDNNFSKPLRKRIQFEMANLSKNYSHAYSQQNSPKLLDIFQPGLTIESLYFFVATSVTLDIVLWTYYVNFPMLFNPVDILKKFGFSPPAIFATPYTTEVIRKSMHADDFDFFKNYSEQQEEVKFLMHWYHSMPDLTEEQIWEMSDTGNEKDETAEMHFLKIVTKIRAFSELIYQSENDKKEADKKIESTTEETVESYAFYHKWSKIYKNVKS